MKAIPNYISCSRIVFSLLLIFTKPLGTAFYVIYVVCGFTDMADGFIARKAGATSRLGEKLDSVADAVMAGVLLVALYPMINLPTEIVIWVISIGVIKLISMAVGLKKYKTFAMLHTLGNKITGLALFVFVMLLPHINATALMYIICVLATMAAIEELIILLTSSQLQPNKKSIFSN